MERAHDVGDGALVRTIMRRQARLGLKIATVFVLILVGLPLLNLYLPEAMATRVGGFSLTWLFLAVLFYPVTWLLSWRFVQGSDRVEDDLIREMRGGEGLQTLEPTGLSPRSPLQDEPLGEGEARIKKKLFVEEEAE